MFSTDRVTTTGHRIRFVLSFVLPFALAPLWLACWSYLPRIGWFSTVGGFDLLLVLIAATVMDLRAMTIPNWITYPAIISAGVTNAVWSMGLIGDPMMDERWPLSASGSLGAIGLTESLVGLVACFCALFWNYAIARRGAGDVKLASVIGAWLGIKCGISAIVFSLLLAASVVLTVALWKFGVVPIVVHLFQKLVRGTVGSGYGNSDIETWLRRPTPMAPALAGGTILVFLIGNLFD